MADNGQYDSQINIEQEDSELEITMQPEAVTVYGGSVVNSVNGQVGDVILTTSDLENTSDYQTGTEVQSAIGSAVADKQDTLVSGTNIKTINNESILGSGNITIQGGGTTDFDNLTNRPKYNGTAMTGSTNIPEITETTVTNWGFTKNTGTYSKPQDGIPKTDLESAVQTSLGKADTAIQDISGKQDKLTAGSNITIASDGKTISATNTTYEAATESTAGLMSAADKTKLDGISSGAGVNVKSNWTENDSNSDAYILNKPTIPVVNNSTITVQMNGSTVDTFTTNAASAKTINLGTVVTDVSGKQNTIDSSHKLSADLVDDTSATNKFVTSAEKTTWNGKYIKPSGGIPKTDLTNDIQTSLGKADTALQSYTETDPTVPSHVKSITQSNITSWNNKSDFSGNYNDLSNKPTIPDELKDLSDDSTHRLVTDTEKSTWNNKGTYSKPSGGIPKTDLASAVQTSLGKADTALQSHQDISGKEDKTNKVTSLSSSSTDTQYPSAKVVYDNISGNILVDFDYHLGIVKATDLSLYGLDALGNYHYSIPVIAGEKYIISCYSSNTSYPGAFYTLNGVKVSSIFEDSGVTHLDAEITVPSGVDTLYVNNKSTKIALLDWKLYKVLTPTNYCKENNNRIRNLETERKDEQLESLRRLKNLENVNNFRWKTFDKAYYCFINDDAKKWLHVAYDVFHAHNKPLGAAVISDNMELHNDTETPSNRSIKDTLDAIVADGGEVLVHYSGNLLSTDTFETWYNKVIRDGKREIERFGFKPRGLILADSSSRQSAIGEEICERFFDYADNVGTKTQYKIARKQFSDTSTVADVKTWINQTVTTPGIYPIMMHGPSAEPWATSAGLDEILTYIENTYSTTAEISTYSAVIDRFGTNGFLTLEDLPIYNGGVQ